MSGFLIGRGGDNRRWRATAIVVAACFALFGLFGHAPGHSIAAVHRGGVATTTLTLMHFNGFRWGLLRWMKSLRYVIRGPPIMRLIDGFRAEPRA